jgi:hypothetical protein
MMTRHIGNVARLFLSPALRALFATEGRRNVAGSNERPIFVA